MKLKFTFLFIALLSLNGFSQGAPSPCGITALYACDDNGDGFEVFNLVEGFTFFSFCMSTSEDENDYSSISYYETEEDMNSETNAIANPTAYTNLSNPQNIYYRVNAINANASYESLKSTDNYIEVNSLAMSITPFEVCDDESGDGIETFDLSSKNAEISDGQTGVSISYYLNLTDAESKVNTLPMLYTNVVNHEIIYVRAENYITGCYKVTTLELIVEDCGDTDNDGVINSDEDINGNGNLDDDDTDKDGIPNYKDEDDDGDKINTADELIDQSNIAGKISGSSKTARTFIDTDSDTIENYIDDDDDGDGILTKDEDYNLNGTPLDDDTNLNYVPDYLEKEVALKVKKYESVEFFIFPNPTNNSVTLRFNKDTKGKVKLGIYDIQGKLIFNQKRPIENNLINLDVSNLKSGLYFLKVKNGIGEATHKLILN
jgi:hypothetical protein